MDRGSRIAWEAQLPNGQCTELHVERHGFETWPGQCAVFLDEFRDVRNCFKNHRVRFSSLYKIQYSKFQLTQEQLPGRATSWNVHCYFIIIVVIIIIIIIIIIIMLLLL